MDGSDGYLATLKQDDPTRFVKSVHIDGTALKVHLSTSTEAICLPSLELEEELSAEDQARCLLELAVQAVAQRLSEARR